jgi:hypothetical protein
MLNPVIWDLRFLCSEDLQYIMFVLVMTCSFVSTAPPFRKERKMAEDAFEMLVSSCKTTQNHNLDQPYNICIRVSSLLYFACYRLHD